MVELYLHCPQVLMKWCSNGIIVCGRKCIEPALGLCALWDSGELTSLPAAFCVSLDTAVCGRQIIRLDYDAELYMSQFTSACILRGKAIVRLFPLMVN